MLRKTLLSVGLIALTIIINLIVTVRLLERMGGLSHAQMNEQPFHHAVAALADHAAKLNTQIYAAFLAREPAELALIEKQAAQESTAATAALGSLANDATGILNRSLQWDDPADSKPGPVSVPASLLVQRVKTMLGDLDSTVARAIALSRSNLEASPRLVASRTALSKAARDTLSLQSIDPKAYDALTRGVMAALSGTEQLTLMNVAGPQFKRGYDKLLAAPAVTDEQKARLATLSTQFQEVYELSRAQIAAELDSKFLGEHAVKIDGSALERLQALRSETTSERGQQIVSSSDYTRRTILITTIVGLVAGTVLALLVSLPTVRAVNSVKRGILAIADGDLRDPKIRTSRDETREMAEALSNAVRGMRDAVGRERIEWTQVARDRQAAEQLTQKLQVTLASVNKNALALTQASGELSETAQRMSANSQQTTEQSTGAAGAAEQVSASLGTVANAAEQMSLSIEEIARSAAEASNVANQAVTVATETSSTVDKLGASSAQIGEVIKAITSIAQRTNLLALNATIEAASAGEAGRGFAVVASEVKALARQTAEATERISSTIEAIQTDTGKAVHAISQIGIIIRRINEIQTSIAAAVEEQANVTREIARNTNEAARGSGEITRNITSVSLAAKGTSAGAGSTLSAARELARLAGDLKQIVESAALSNAGA